MKNAGLILLTLVLTTSAGGERAPGALPVPRDMPTVRRPPRTPMDAVAALGRAYSERSEESLASLLTDDYRFHFDPKGSVPLSRYPDGFDRAHELQVMAGLFRGVTHAGGGVSPAAESVSVSIDSLTLNADPEHPDSTTHYQLVVAHGFVLTMSLPGGREVRTTRGLQAFHVVRGDAAVVARGQTAEASRWYIRRWLEGTDAMASALAGRTGECGEPEAAPAGRAPALGIRPLGNPACPTIDVLCDIPGSGPAGLDVFDVLGRLRNHRDVVAATPGTIRLSAGEGAHLAPGVYWVRLTQARRSVSRMVVVAR